MVAEIQNVEITPLTETKEEIIKHFQIEAGKIIEQMNKYQSIFTSHPSVYSQSRREEAEEL